MGEVNARNVSIGIVDDLFVEANEIFTVTASSTNDRVMFIGSPATVTIEDNDGERFYIEGKQSTDLLIHDCMYTILCYVIIKFATELQSCAFSNISTS